MTRQRYQAFAFALLAAIGFPLSGASAGSFEMVSYMTMTDGGYGEEADGAKVGMFLFEGTAVSPSGSAPFHRAVVECRFVTYQIGGTEIPYKDRVGAVGSCRVNDRDGDIFIFETQRTIREQQGTWKLVHGTGKYQGGTGSGTYDFEVLPGQPSGQIPIEWRGELTM
jgi:hypothetical protein